MQMYLQIQIAFDSLSNKCMRHLLQMCFSDAALGLMQMTVFQGPMVEEEHL